eukprot:1693753-Prymnesium_polylepis.1
MPTSNCAGASSHGKSTVPHLMGANGCVVSVGWLPPVRLARRWQQSGRSTFRVNKCVAGPATRWR